MPTRTAVIPAIPGAIRCPSCGNHTLKFAFRGECTMSTYFGQWTCLAAFPLLRDGEVAAYDSCDYHGPWELAMVERPALEVAA